MKDHFQNLTIYPDFNALPAQLGVPKTKTEFITPRERACQLKALALFTDLSVQGKTITIPTKVTENEICKCVSSSLLFKTTQGILPIRYRKRYIIAIFDLQRKRRHLGEDFKLNEKECRSLLNYYRKNNPGQLLGALGYEWLHLSLKSLLREHNNLLSLKNSVNTFPFAFEMRLKQIEQTLKTKIPVMKKSTILEQVTLNTGHIMHKINTDLFSTWRLYALYKTWEKNVFTGAGIDNGDVAMDALGSEINEETFMMYFPQYVRIAHTSHLKHHHALEQFCYQYLCAYCHVSQDKQDSNMPLLVNLLYRLCHNPGCFTDNQTISITDLQKKAFKLNCATYQALSSKGCFSRRTIV